MKNNYFVAFFAMFISLWSYGQEAPIAEVEILTPISVCNPGDCTTLFADYFKIKPTNTYTVEPINYQNLYSYTGGTVLNITTDDKWSPEFNLPFKFCFYGQIYDKVIVGSNGVISFNTTAAGGAGGTCPWSYSTTIPNAGFPIKTAIYGVYQDTDLGGPIQNTAIQNVNYYAGGVAPNRYFVANFNRLPQFSCGGNLGANYEADSGLSTTQIVIYETTNIIDVYVYRRTVCNSWQSGRGVIGVQNATGTAAVAPPGRNTGNWSVLGTTASPSEAWRFFPASADPNPPLVVVNWYNEAGDLIGTGDSVTVCPEEDQTYTAIATYARCGQTDNVVVQDTFLLEIAPPLPVNDPLDISVCTTDPVDIGQTDYILNPVDPFEYEVYYFLDETAANLGATSQALTPAQVANFTTVLSPVTVYAYIENTFGDACFNVRPFQVNIGNPSGTFTYPPDTDGTPTTYCFNSNSALAPVLDELTSGGTYTVIPTNATDVLTIDPDTGVLDLTGATPGTYEIKYTIVAGPAPDGCPEYNTSTTIVIESCINAVVSNSGNVCEGTATFDLFAAYTEVGGATTTYEWKDNAGTVVSTDQNPVGVAVPATAGDYTYSLVITQNGTASEVFTTVLTVHPTPVASFVTVSTTICTNATITLVFSGTPGATVNFTDGTNAYQVILDATGNGEFTTPTLAADTTYTLEDVTGTTVPACSATLSNSILISVGLPTATIIGFTEAVICSGTATGLEIQGTPGSTVSYTKDGVAQTDVVIPVTGLLTIDTGIQTVTTTTVYTYELTEVVSNSTPPCSDTMTGESATLTVNALPTATFTATTASVCEGTAATLNFVGTPDATVTYNNGTADLTVVLDATGNATVTTALLSVDTTFTLVSAEVTDTILCSNPLTGTVIVTIDFNPAITTQPVGATKCIGESVTFTVVATGTTLSYQWFFNGVAIAGATNATYSIAPLVATDAGDYTVEVSGICGTAVLSDPATLVLTEETLITVPPVVSQTVCEGDLVTINVTATGTNLTYQWFKGATAIAGATNPTLSIAGATTANAGIYTCVITNPCQVVTTTTSEVIVNELPKIVTQPVGITICEGAGINLSVGTTGTGLTYQWFLDGNPLAGATTATYADATVTLAEAGSYTVTVSGSCNPAETSIAAVVVVNQAAAFTQQPVASTIVCSGTGVTLTVATSGGTGVTYQWFKGASPIAGATAPSYNIASTVVADSGNYTCQVTVVSCGTITSEVAVVVVNQAPVITSQPQSQEICVGQTATFTVVATGTNLTYQWYEGATAIPGATSNTYSIANATEANSGDFYCIITSTSCPNIQTATVTLLVKPLPFATIVQGNPSTICEGESTQVIFNGTAGAVVIYTINGGTQETITLNAGVPTILPTGTLTETTVYELVSVTYTGADACSQTLTGSATVTVHPLPEVTLEDGTICIDPITLATTRNYLLNTGLNEADYTFEWFDLNGSIALATNSFYEVSVVGQYSVTITDIITGCQATAYATVGESSPPIDFDYTVSGFFANNPTIVITASPVGNYEYQLDYGPFQESNIFDNVSAGTHTITVRDPEACDVLTKEVLVVDYPRYFTPNGDGINDTWNIPSINGISFTKIYIFDRFGKLIKEMTTSGLGWDGTYNGKPLPATDYWFTINYQENAINKEFRAHFSLKR